MRSIVGVLAAAALLAPAARAQHAPFQAFFATVCAGSPGGSLATRCGETPGGAGDLSGDSELSLNPNQSLAAHDASQARVRQLSQDIEERLAARRADEGASLATPIGFILNGRYTRSERDRSFDGSPLQPEPLQRERGYTANEGSVQVGADLRVGEGAVIGALFAYSRSEFDPDRSTAPSFVPASTSGEAETDSYFLTAFGSLDLGMGFWVDGSLGGGITRHTLTRRAVFQETTRTIAQTLGVLEGDTDGYELSATAGAGYDRQDGALSYGPYLRVRYVNTTLDGYAEDDPASSGLAMRYDEETQHSAVGVVGLRASYALSTGIGVVVPSVRVEWEHEYARNAFTTHQSFNRDGFANDYALRGDAPDRDYANVGAGVTAVLPGGWMAFAEYEGLFGYRDLARHRATAGLRVELR